MHPELSDPAHVDPIVDVLVELAATGRALELGIGTGRIALPLANRGVEVHGIDFSKATVEKLHQKPGGAEIPVAPGDFSDVAVEGKYSLIFVVFNTFFGLLTQEAQVRCFQNVARHLANRGVFLREAFVPDATRFNRGQNVSAQSVEIDRCRLSIEHHNPVYQIVDSCHLILSKDDVRVDADKAPLHVASRIGSNGKDRRHAATPPLEQLGRRFVYSLQRPTHLVIRTT